MSPADIVGGLTSIGARFALVGFLPIAALALFVLALVWSGAPGEEPDLARILEEARALDAWAGGLLALGLLVAALVAQPLQIAGVRLLEGYWGRRLAAPGIRLQRRRLARLRAATKPAATREEALARAGAESARRRLFPERDADLLPTRLGNALRAAESRAGAPYGLDAVVVWPRLYPLLPEPVRALADDTRNQLDLAARFTIVFLVAAAVSAALLLTHGAWLAVPAACLALAWLSYRGAVSAAVGYGEAVRAAIDLHRFDLLRALHLPLPATRAAEVAANRHLTAFLLQDAPLDLRYAHGGAAGEDGEAGGGEEGKGAEVRDIQLVDRPEGGDERAGG